ncbi:MAG: S41 family peptidase [Sphingobacteriales bacterium]
MKNFCLLLLIILITSCGVSRNTGFSPERKFPVEKMQRDFSILRDIYEKSHPGIYWYTSKDSINYFFDKGYSSIKDSMTEPGFKNLVSQIIQHIQCGHSSTKYSFKYDDYLFNNRLPQFPLQIKVLNDSLINLFNAHRKDSLFYRGAVIKSIDGYSAKQIIETICSTISTDGNSLNFKYQQITNNFPYYYTSVFGTKKEYQVSFINKEGKDTVIPLKVYDPKLDSARRVQITGFPEKTKRQLHKEKQQRTFSFAIDTTNKLAILNVNNFNTSLKRKFIKRAFKKVNKQGIQNIAVDLRLNGGGLINKSIYLAKYLKEQPFRFMDSVIAVRKKLAHPRYVRQRFIYNLGLWWVAKKRSDGNYHFRYYEDHPYKLKKYYHFNGKIYLVTGGNTFSAASLFVSSLKGQSNVIVLGEETGGGYYGNNGVFIPDIVLPNTHIRVRLPLFRIVNNKSFPKDGHGVKPDIEVAPTVQTIMRNIDPKIDKVIELVKQNQ